MKADIVIFDSEKFRDKCTYEARGNMPRGWSGSS